MRSGAEEKEEGGGRRRTTDIKSNNPHLAGGEQRLSFDLVRMADSISLWAAAREALRENL